MAGHKFAASAVGATYTFVLGDEGHIPGLNEIALGMRRGGYRRGIIPPDLGYDDDASKAPPPLGSHDHGLLLGLIADPTQES